MHQTKKWLRKAPVLTHISVYLFLVTAQHLMKTEKFHVLLSVVLLHQIDEIHCMILSNYHGVVYIVYTGTEHITSGYEGRHFFRKNG